MTELTPGGVYRTWPDGYSVRRMTPEDARTVEDWFCEYSATGPDLEVTLRAMPPEVHGFYAGDFNGRMVASAIRIPVSEDVYYGSCYYVDKAYRLRRFGTRLRDEVAAECVGSRSLAIDAHDDVEAMNHRKGYSSSHGVVQYAGVPKFDNVRVMEEKSWSICPLSELSFEEVITYDDKCFIQPGSQYRRAVLEAWRDIPGSRCLAARGNHGNVCGVGFRRPALTPNKHLIGPLYADSADIASALLCQLWEDVREHEMTISVSETNPASVELAKSLDLHSHLVMIRMYLNKALDWDTSRVFGVTSVDTCGF